MNFVTRRWIAVVLMVLIGALAGFFVVPMNALLQHRGHVLVGAGHSIAVQNFNENTSILVMIALYSLLLQRRLLDLHRDHRLRTVRRRHHGAGAALVPAQPQRRTATRSSACSPSRAPRTLTRK